MKIIKKSILKDGTGYIDIVPDHVEDLWHLYHIINFGDYVTTSTIRKIEKQSTSGRVIEKRRFDLTINVQKVDFDPESKTIRLSGKNVGENDYVKKGQHHTLEIEPTRKLSISKKLWDSIHLKRLSDSTDLSKSAEVGAVILEEGLAYVCLITDNMTITKQKIEVTIPKKRYTITAHDKALSKFFEAILVSIEKNFDFNVIKCLIIASPGFYKDQLTNFIFKLASQKEEHKYLLSHKSKFLMVHSTSGHRESLNEVLMDSKVLQKMENTKAALEVKTLENFFNMLNNSPDKAFYGFDDVQKANEQKGIETLMVTDELFRSSKVKERVKYVKLCERVQEYGGNVIIFSNAHITGQQLGKISGVAAILRFPIIIEDEVEDYSESSSDSSDEEEDEEEKLEEEMESLDLEEELFM